VPSFWWHEPSSPLLRAALAPLALAELGWRSGARAHRALYELGLRQRVRLPARVVSVGNLAVGGSGKTPLVAWLARELARRGHKVAVLSRGVGGRGIGETNVVSDGERCLASSLDVGDEPLWIARSAPGVPVLAGKNRVALGLHAIAVFGAECVLLDDGFQHHRLVRDVDLVCVDARAGLGNGRVLPRGPLREPPARLERAHAVVLTRAERGAASPPEDARLPANLPRFRVAIAPRGLRDLASGESVPLAALRGRACGVLAAIARPERLCDAAAVLGARVQAVRRFADHHAYESDEIRALDPTLLWITTAKDAVKIPPAWVTSARLLALEEEVEPAGALELLEWLQARLSGAGAAS
jgi:tetraacyldisaccharide 4'-kinase